MHVPRGDGSAIAVEVVGAPDAAPVLLCHGLADSRLSARWFAPVARDLGLRVIAPDRPGIGGTDPRHLASVAGWADDARLVLDALGVDQAGVLGVSGGGPFAAACAAVLPGRVRCLALLAPLGLPEWPTVTMASGERFGLAVARRSPAFSGWAMGCLAALARRSPELFLSLSATSLPEADVRALADPGLRESFLASYIEAFRRGYGGTAQDLRVLTRSWGFDLASITVPTLIRHGDADLTVPVQHARLYAERIPDAHLRIDPGHGHFSILTLAREVLAPLAA